MWKAALVGAIALATAGTSLSVTTVFASDVASGRYQAAGQPVLSEAQIGRMKAALKLTREQERHWPAVAAALHGLRRGAGTGAAYAQGFADDAAATIEGLHRLMWAAMPLFQSLDNNQKRVARRLVDAMGFGHFAASL
jgi:hypothetical protein